MKSLMYFVIIVVAVFMATQAYSQDPKDPKNWSNFQVVVRDSTGAVIMKGSPVEESKKKDKKVDDKKKKSESTPEPQIQYASKDEFQRIEQRITEMLYRLRKIEDVYRNINELNSQSVAKETDVDQKQFNAFMLTVMDSMKILKEQIAMLEREKSVIAQTESFEVIPQVREIRETQVAVFQTEHPTNPVQVYNLDKDAVKEMLKSGDPSVTLLLKDALKEVLREDTLLISSISNFRSQGTAPGGLNPGGQPEKTYVSEGNLSNGLDLAELDQSAKKAKDQDSLDFLNKRISELKSVSDLQQRTLNHLGYGLGGDKDLKSSSDKADLLKQYEELQAEVARQQKLLDEEMNSELSRNALIQKIEDRLEGRDSTDEDVIDREVRKYMEEHRGGMKNSNPNSKSNQNTDSQKEAVVESNKVEDQDSIQDKSQENPKGESGIDPRSANLPNSNKTEATNGVQNQTVANSGQIAPRVHVQRQQVRRRRVVINNYVDCNCN